jgi:hypothetical protein
MSAKEFTDSFVIDTSRYNTLQLSSLLRRASAMADTWCKQQLRATSDTYMESMYPTRNGTLKVWPKYRPVRSVSSLSYQFNAYSDWDVLDLSTGLDTFKNYFEYGGQLFAQCDKLTIQYTYVNGFPVTTLNNSVNVDDTTCMVNDSTGISVGDVLSVYDSANSEDITVINVSGTTLTVSPFAYSHPADVQVSGFANDDISQATGMIAANLIWRGTEGKVVEGDNEYKEQYTSDSVITSDIKMLLQPYQVNR